MDPLPFLILAILTFILVNAFTAIIIWASSRKKTEYVQIEKKAQPKFLAHEGEKRSKRK